MNIYRIVVVENGIATTYRVAGSDPVNVAYVVGVPLNCIISIELDGSKKTVDYL